jgi:DNA-3-methyladenine glycosylase
MPRPPSRNLNWLAGDATAVAPQLLGWQLSTHVEGHTTSGRVVETEAYMGSSDPASHGFRPMTLRTTAMFQEAGTIYVYFTYGSHYCVNIVTGPLVEPQAVLIRALEPTTGIELMIHRRGLTDVTKLCRGPGNLTKAMGINATMNTTKIGELVTLEPPSSIVSRQAITASPRIGITKATDKPWRYYISGSKFVSGRTTSKT